MISNQPEAEADRVAMRGTQPQWPTHNHNRHMQQQVQLNSNATRCKLHQVNGLDSHTSNHHRHLQVCHGHNRRRRRRKSVATMATLSPLFLFIVILATTPSWAFNLDTQNAIVHQGSAGSYFGYSVAQHRDRLQSWLLVGAPRANTEQPDTRQAGAVFKCPTTSAKSCQPIPFDNNGPSVIKLQGETRQSDNKTMQYFGATLASANDNGTIVACAPQYVYHSTNLRRRDPVGACYVSRGSFSGFLEYSPCRIDDQWGHHHLGSCQAGFSAAITKDGSRLLMGAPGAHVWQGLVFSHNLNTHTSKSTSWVNPHSEDDSLIGYALVVGRFSAQSYQGFSNAQVSADNADLAIGVPRGAEMTGKVMLVDRDMKTMFNLTGELVGSRFGDALAVVDVNGDGLDDLLVGAPMYYNHTERTQDRGRVYVYLQTIRHELQLAQKLDGQHQGGRFGTSIANTGDLNRDGIQDVAVGAPYGGPDNRGAIYIFLGRRGSVLNGGGLQKEPDQVVLASQVRGFGSAPGFRSLGFALSGGMDVDANGYPDLLVGDYASDRAVLLRTRPVVNVTTSLTFQPENFNLDERTCLLPGGDGGASSSVSCITMHYCIKYSGYNVDQKLPFVFDVKLDTENKGAPRLFFLAADPTKNEERNTSTLTKDQQLCRANKIYISRQVRDKLTPLKVDIDYQLASDSFARAPADTPLDLSYPPADKLRPILNKSNANKLQKVANIQKNCGSDNVCTPDLVLKMVANTDEYTVGSDEKLVLDVTVKNFGDDAFESMFYLTMPMSIHFNNVANKSRTDYPICYPTRPDLTGTNVLMCDLGNPMARNEVLKFSVVTEPSKTGAYAGPDLTFVGHVNSTNPELDDRHREDNTVPIGIPIRVETNLQISGMSMPTIVSYNMTQAQLQLEQQQQRAAAPRAASILDIFGTESLVVQQQQQPVVVQKQQLVVRPRKSELDVGPEVSHSYQLVNKGPSSINDIALVIMWPSKNRDLKHLLYLPDEPQTSPNVKCRTSSNATGVINPLGLSVATGNALQYDDASAQNANKRYKRQAQSQTPQITQVDSYVLQQQFSGCAPGQCTKFECNVYNLNQNEPATIKIRSRLDLDTVRELSLQDFDISSKLVAQIKSLPYNVSTQSLPPYVYKVETEVHTSGIGVRDLLPWWLILLAILLGIVLFALLVWFLKALGFFARKRPPKGAEREPLTPTPWNEQYRYSPGDTAL